MKASLREGLKKVEEEGPLSPSKMWKKFFLTAKEAVQQSIRSICLSVCLFVCATLEILLLKGSNQQIRAQTETN